MNRIAAVIIAHNSEREIGRCLDSLPAGLQVVVVDNASQDGTRAEVFGRSSVQLIANPWNRGFAAAANQGIAAVDCEYVLLLNPDVELIGGLDSLAAECAQPKVAAAGPKLLSRDGRPQQGFMFRRFPTPPALAFEVIGLNRLWPGNPVNRRYRCLDADSDLAADVEQPAGAFLMIRRTVWRQLGGFDEAFRPVWFEDVDFLKRAAAAGYRMRFVPSAAARHAGGHSVAQVPSGLRQLYWYGNLLMYAVRHFSRAGRSAVCLALMLGSVIRAISETVCSLSLRPVSTYAQVFRLAAVQLLTTRPEPVLFRLPSEHGRAA
jgi:N-acetylglucosaminyl-diphospho-decaprenol L-rhamnosyltransferase